MSVTRIVELAGKTDKWSRRTKAINMSAYITFCLEPKNPSQRKTENTVSLSTFEKTDICILCTHTLGMVWKRIEYVVRRSICFQFELISLIHTYVYTYIYIRMCVYSKVYIVKNSQNSYLYLIILLMVVFTVLE